MDNLLNKQYQIGNILKCMLNMLMKKNMFDKVICIKDITGLSCLNRYPEGMKIGMSLRLFLQNK